MTKSFSFFGKKQNNKADKAKASAQGMFRNASFETASMPMMTVDVDLNITNYNQAVLEMLGEHGTDFKTIWPNISKSNLIGSNVETSGNTSFLQRSKFSNVSRLPMTSDVSVGDLKYSLTIGAVYDKDDNHCGNTLEWNHVTEARTNTGLISAIDRESAIIEFTLDGEIVTANKNFLDTVGYSLNEIVGQHHRMFVTKEFSASREYQNFWSTLNRGETVSGKFERVGKTGNQIWLEASYTAVLDDQGQPFKVVKIASDITAEENVRLTNTGVMSAMDRDSALIEFTLDGTIVTANKNFLDTVGYSLNEIVGQHHRMFVTKEFSASRDYQDFWAKLNRGETVAGKFERVGKTGNQIWLEASYTAVLDEAGRPAKVIKIASDITADENLRLTNTGVMSAIDRDSALIEFTLAGEIVTANQNFLSTVGYSLDEIVGKHHRMFVTNEFSASRDYQDFWAKLNNGETVAGKFERVGKTGNQIWLEASYTAVLDEAGRPAKVVKIASDITKLENERLTNAGIMSAIDRDSALIEFTLDGEIVTANKNFLATVGYSMAEIKGKHHRMFVTPELANSREYENFWATLKGGETVSGKFERVGKTGNQIWLEASYTSVLDEAGRPAKVVKIASNITNEENVRLTNTGIISAIDRDSALIEFTLDGEIVTANQNFLATVGYSMSEIKGKHHRMFVTDAYRASPEYKQFWATLKGGETVSGKFERVGKTGNQIWLDASYTAVLDDTGNPVKVVKIASDITKIENDRTTSERKLAQHAQEQQTVVSTLASGLKALSTGDLTNEITAEFSGEYKQLKDDFNSAVTTLNGTVRRVINTAVGIQTGASEISQASDDMAKRTENQAAALEETAAALDEITATVQETAKSANQANSVVTTTRDDAEKSGEVVRSAVEAMSAIKDSSGEIEKIIGVIDEIAFQTNLLALNAGVEAARAGEAGRGFAVVASEVRALAQRSSDAAKDIKDLISASGKHVETGVELVGQTGTALENIVTRVAEVSTLVSDIAGSAQEQSTALAEVNSAVNDMDRVTQQNAAMVEESTAAAHSLTNDAKELTQLVREFDIGEGSEPAPSNVVPQKPVVAAQQQRAANYFATQGNAAVDMSAQEDDWQSF